MLRSLRSSVSQSKPNMSRRAESTYVLSFASCSWSSSRRPRSWTLVFAVLLPLLALFLGADEFYIAMSRGISDLLPLQEHVARCRVLPWTHVRSKRSMTTELL